MKILIAEDDESNYLLLRALLKKHEIFHAENGVEALDVVEKQSIDIVLMDIKMPSMDGLEATKRIKALHPEMPVVAITAYAFDADEKMALQAGCDYFIAKPLKREELYKVIEQFGSSH